MNPLLDIEEAHVELTLARNVLGRASRTMRAVQGVSFGLHAGRTVGLVGESGSGKSTLAAAIVGLVPLTSGRIRFGGEELTPAARRQKPGRIQIVFQDPRSSLNPRLKVGPIIGEPLDILKAPAADRAGRVSSLLDEVGLPASFADRYPHELSGGQRQRVAIARAIATDPQVLILDEPTSALDVSVQARVVNLLLALQARRGVSYLFISHDIALVRHVSDDVVVMRGGAVVETGRTGTILQEPSAAYTRALLDAAPTIAVPFAAPAG